jgi:hypothetical protein
MTDPTHWVAQTPIQSSRLRPTDGSRSVVPVSRNNTATAVAITSEVVAKGQQRPDHRPIRPGRGAAPLLLQLGHRATDEAVPHLTGVEAVADLPSLVGHYRVDAVRAHLAEQAGETLRRPASSTCGPPSTRRAGPSNATRSTRRGGSGSAHPARFCPGRFGQPNTGEDNHGLTS